MTALILWYSLRLLKALLIELLNPFRAQKKKNSCAVRKLHGKSTSLSNQMLLFNWSDWSFLQFSSERCNSYPLYKKVNFQELLLMLCKEVVIPAPDQILTVSSCRMSQMSSFPLCLLEPSLYTHPPRTLIPCIEQLAHLKCDKCCKSMLNKAISQLDSWTLRGAWSDVIPYDWTPAIFPVCLTEDQPSF